MAVLSDASIRERLMTGSLGVSPFEMRRVQPASIDLTLGPTLRVQEYGTRIDPECDQSDTWRDVALCPDGRWLLGGQRLYLGASQERVRIPDDCVGFLSGISSLGRLGLQIHCAGLIDPGFRGEIVFEVVLFGQAGYLRPGQRIAQLTLLQLDQAAAQPYRGKYQHDTGPVASRSFMDVKHG